jgi:hypothetical protein
MYPSLQEKLRKKIMKEILSLPGAQSNRLYTHNSEGYGSTDQTLDLLSRNH